MEQLGDVIRQLRLAAGLSQAELAARADMSAPLLSLFEKNRREPTLRGLRRIAANLGVPAGVLFAVALANASEDAADPMARAVTERLVEVARKQILEQQLLRPGSTGRSSPRVRRGGENSLPTKTRETADVHKSSRKKPHGRRRGKSSSHEG